MSVTLEEVRKNWMILAAFASGAVVWGGTVTSLSYAKDEIKDNAQQIASVKDQVNQIKIAAEGVKAASEAQQRATERQLDQIIRQLERISENGSGN